MTLRRGYPAAHASAIMNAMRKPAVAQSQGHPCRRLARVASLAGAVTVACSPEPLPPRGEVVVEIHTDAPVPALVAAVRVDAFDAEGRWMSSRDIATPSEHDWPFSFSLVLSDASIEQRALVRLRAYPAGRLRDYIGERYAPRPSYAPIYAPSTLDALCANAPVHTPPLTLSVRRGSAPVTHPLSGGDCGAGRPIAGVNGFAIKIARASVYRLEVIGSYPPASSAGPSDNLLFIRQACANPGSQLGCNDDQLPTSGIGEGSRPRLDVALTPGRYTVFVASRSGDPHADVIVQVADINEEIDPAPPPRAPLLLNGDQDVTPNAEPQPSVTIDRLVTVTLIPGTIQQRVVTLSGACFGTMSRLASDPFASETCVDSEAELVDVSSATANDRVPAPESFATPQPCEDVTHDEHVACVPGGVFLLGDQTQSAEQRPLSTAPERVAQVDRFWLDRREVTVRRYRSALTRGLPRPAPTELFSNSQPLATTSGHDDEDQCTWIDTPRADEDREPLPLSCIAWRAARAFCQFVGGDLPTEAQWELAATGSSQGANETFPWGGSAPPSCDRAVFGRFTDNAASGATDLTGFLELVGRLSGACRANGFGPVSADARASPSHDVTAIGIIDMGGNLSEWVRDAAYPLDHDCWRAQPLDEPACLDEDPPLQGVRGGSWVHAAFWTAGATRGARRQPIPGEIPPTYIGFRCAYDAPPDDASFP